MSLCLIVEDEPPQRGVLSTTLQNAGHHTLEAETGAEARGLVESHRPEIVLLDLGLPDMDGLALIPQILAISPLSRIVVLTGRNSVSAAVASLRAGARHYLVKPWDVDELLVVVDRETHAVDLAESQRRAPGSDIFWGRDAAMLRVRQQLHRLAESPWTPLLLEGETGTGKEVIARELHRLTAAAGPFVALNCASIPSELLESELFGHERGAFTGADCRRRGLAEVAHDGTLFLDEIGEMDPGLQTKLLRFLQDGRFRRVGGHEEVESRCRFVAATHRDLRAMQETGDFREDLYYRLSVVRIAIPPLRERRGDLLPLSSRLIETVAASLGRSPRSLSPEAEREIRDHAWRGNVRELRNRIERALVLGDEPTIQAYDLDLPEHVSPGASAAIQSEPDRLRETLARCDWNVSEAARQLGVERHRLRYRMRKFGIVQPQR